MKTKIKSMNHIEQLVPVYRDRKPARTTSARMNPRLNDSVGQAFGRVQSGGHRLHIVFYVFFSYVHYFPMWFKKMCKHPDSQFN